MFRRSSSTSHIPTLKSDSRPRSKSLIRTSTKDIPASSRKGKESFDKQPALKRSISSSSLKRISAATPTLVSSKNPAKKSTIWTPILSSSGFKRSTPSTLTPSSSKSPYKIGLDKINDKNWISEQYAKVRRYIHEHPQLDDHVADSIKPPTIKTFAYVMDVLLKQIDPRIEINTVNYKDQVLTILKTIHYPGNISNSLLKTVNTMHAWPQVISMIAWLVELIQSVQCSIDGIGFENDLQYKKVQCVTEYIVSRYLSYNSDERDLESVDREFGEKFEKILNFDEENAKKLEQEVEELRRLTDNQKKQLAEQNTANDKLKMKVAELQSGIDEFYLNKESKLDDIDCEIAVLKSQRAKLVPAIESKRNKIVTLMETLNSQPCTVEEKKRMMKHIEELKHTIDLKKENIKQRKCLKDDSDFRLAKAKKNVETEVYRWNNSLMKLTIMEPELKMLHLQDTDFTPEKFGNDLLTLKRNFQFFMDKFEKEITLLNLLVSKQKSQIAKVEMQIESDKKRIHKLTDYKNSTLGQIEKYHEDIEHMTAKREKQKEIFKEKIKKLNETAPNLEQVKENLREVKEQKVQKELEFAKLQKESLDFFIKLRDGILENLVEMNNIRSDIFDGLKKRLENCREEQDKVLKDVHQLDKVKDD